MKPRDAGKVTVTRVYQGGFRPSREVRVRYTRRDVTEGFFLVAALVCNLWPFPGHIGIAFAAMFLAWLTEAGTSNRLRASLHWVLYQDREEDL